MEGGVKRVDARAKDEVAGAGVGKRRDAPTRTERTLRFCTMRTLDNSHRSLHF